MAMSNYLFPPTSENPIGFSVRCLPAGRQAQLLIAETFVTS